VTLDTPGRLRREAHEADHRARHARAAADRHESEGRTEIAYQYRRTALVLTDLAAQLEGRATWEATRYE